jgi:PEP-CTERM motif
VSGFPGFSSLVNVTLNIGQGNLSDISVFTPPVPEPATGGLLGISLLALVLVARKYGYWVTQI